MAAPEERPVLSVSEARTGLSNLIGNLENGSAQPVIIGSHRRPQAVLLSYADFREMTNEPSDRRGSLRKDLHARRELIIRLAAVSRLETIAVFGSAARGDDGPHSDIDLLVDALPTATLFDIAQFTTDMEALFGRSVDVVTRSSLRSDDDAHILTEASLL